MRFSRAGPVDSQPSGREQRRDERRERDDPDRAPCEPRDGEDRHGDHRDDGDGPLAWQPYALTNRVASHRNLAPRGFVSSPETGLDVPTKLATTGSSPLRGLVLRTRLRATPVEDGHRKTHRSAMSGSISPDHHSSARSLLARRSSTLRHIPGSSDQVRVAHVRSMWSIRHSSSVSASQVAIRDPSCSWSSRACASVISAIATRLYSPGFDSGCT